MAYGVIVRRADGVQTVNQVMPGGRCFIGAYSISQASYGTTQTYTFPSVPNGSYLRVYGVVRGYHSWTTSTNGSGQAVLTVTALGIPPYYYRGARTTTLLVFTTVTVESVANTYGISIVNDSGERTVSGIFPCPEFLGKITINSSPWTNYVTPNGDYTLYAHSANTSLGAGRNRFILYNIASTSGDIWVRGSSAWVPSSWTGSYDVGVEVCTNSSYTVPEAFVFALDGLTASSDTYGLRIRDTSGNVTFDSGRDHAVVKGIESNFIYTQNTVETLNYSSMSGGQPIFFIPEYYKENYTGVSGQAFSNWYIEKGFVRRTGSTLYTKIIRTESGTEDVYANYSIIVGSTAAITLVVDGTLYGASSI